MRYRRSSVTMGRFMAVALLLVTLGSVDGVSYLVANVGSFQIIHVVAGETGGVTSLTYPHQGYNETKSVTPFQEIAFPVDPSMTVSSGIENKTIAIYVNGDNINMYCNVYSDVYSPLPVAALGTKYIVSSCSPPKGNTWVLLIATHSSTDVDITLMLDGNVTHDNMTYINGDTIHVTLDEYQTFTMKSDYDLTGSVINATNTVAVFSGTMQTDITSFDQLLPLGYFGQEYVVAVDDSYTSYRMQIVSELNSTEITLSNGSTIAIGETRVYRQDLHQNESLYFNTTVPAMVTLCGQKLQTYAFTVVPPVLSYHHQTSIYVDTPCLGLKILTEKNVVDIGVQPLESNVTIQWEEIPGSRYKVGSLCLSRHNTLRSDSKFTVLAYTSDIMYGMYNGGYNFSMELSTPSYGSTTPETQSPASTPAGVSTLPTPVSSHSGTGGQEYAEGVSYLLASLHNNGGYVNAVCVAAGETGGSFRIDYPQFGYNDTRTVTPYGYTSAVTDTSLYVTVGVENKAFIIHVFGEDMGVHGYSGSGIFSPLPISALGSRYVVSTCLGYLTQVVLVIANHNHKTDVDITLMLEGNVTYDNMTYYDGDTIHVTLDEYQTFTMKSDCDLTGTVINATNTVAVFSGAMQGTKVQVLAQLLPVRHHRTEFVLHTGVEPQYRSVTYQLQVICDQSDNEIMLNNGSTFSLGENRVYRQYLAYNEKLYLNATRPVMATLCRYFPFVYQFHGFDVVTPVTYFLNSASFTHSTTSLNILTKQHVTDIEVFTSNMVPITLYWVDIPGSDYKAGTILRYGRYFVRSDSRFAAYGSYSDIVNGGYIFPTDPSTTGVDAGSATPTTQTPVSTAASATTQPTPVSNNTRTGGQEYTEDSPRHKNLMIESCDLAKPSGH